MVFLIIAGIIYLVSILYITIKHKLFAEVIFSKVPVKKNSKGKSTYNFKHQSLSDYFMMVILLLITWSLSPLIAAIFIVQDLLGFSSGNAESKAVPKENKSIKDPEPFESRYRGIEPPQHTSVQCAENTFNLTPGLVIYLEDEPDELISNYFNQKKERFAGILSEIKQKNKVPFEFFYLPEIISAIPGKEAGEVLRYHFPFLRDQEIGHIRSSAQSCTTGSFSKRLLAELGYEGEVFPGLLKLRIPDDRFPGMHVFSYVDLRSTGEEELEKKLWYYFSHLKTKDDPVYYQLAARGGRPEGRADLVTEYSFDYGNHQLAREIREKIEKLRQGGGAHLLLHILGKQHAATGSPSPGPHLSELVIDSAFRILLPGFNNMEIELTPLPKTVFLFFLRHPEGVMLKHLCDHRDELLEIYKLLSRRESMDELVTSIGELTDPTNNSINEKCSRIKEAFLKRFDEPIARWYYITGDRGKEKVIRLDRCMVSWNAELASLPASLRARSAEESLAIDSAMEERYQSAKELLDQQNFTEAIARFTRIVETDPFHFNAWAHRAVAHFETGNYPQALADNDRAIQLEPTITFAHHNRAETKLMLKQYPEALADISLYLKQVNRQCSASYFMRGLIRMELGDVKGACQDWFTANHLGHTEAFKYLKKYPKIKIRSPLLEQRS